jgi:hypothetical protein
LLHLEPQGPQAWNYGPTKIWGVLLDNPTVGAQDYLVDKAWDKVVDGFPKLEECLGRSIVQ